MALPMRVAGAALVASALLTYIARRFALSRGMLDVPNERSSHTRVTPRGGGIAIVVASTLAFLALAVVGDISHELLLALSVGGAAVALVGYVDDRHRLPARVRLTVHVLAAVWAVVWVRGLGTVQFGEHLLHLGWAGTALSVLGIVWVLNLFNFMDGIDGIAAGEALFVAGAGALLASSSAGAGVGAAAWVFAGACAGFLPWNWPPARVFLGDVGSGYLGYITIVLALADAREHPVAIWIWFILGGIFFVDATVTLMRRLFRGDKVHEAHRQHAYQRLARCWNSHLRVTCAVLAIDLVWLFPWALFAWFHREFAAAAAVTATAPLLLAAILLGAGRART
jgi:Fuc2NAc and GlcNAc transferase